MLDLGGARHFVETLTQRTAQFSTVTDRYDRYIVKIHLGVGRYPSAGAGKPAQRVGRYAREPYILVHH